MIVDALQWYPGNGCRGVNDDHPIPPVISVMYKLCGCILVGGAHSGKPHVHPTRCDHGVPVDPGDWIIAEADGSGYYPCKSDVFVATYDPAE